MLLRDLYSNLKVVPLIDNQQLTADTNSLYIDALDLDVLAFLVGAKMTTADGTNYFTPILYGATATPAASGSYSAVGTDELSGAFAVINQTTTAVAQLVAVIQRKYRYYYIKLDETLTADGEFSVHAFCGKAEQPSSSFSATTGTVT